MRSMLGQRRGEADQIAVGQPAPQGFSIDIHAHHVDVPPDVRNYVRDRLSARLEKWAGQLIAVTVRLDDPNGTKGGVDCACEMDAHVAGLAPVVVHERTEDLRSAIDLAIDSLENALRRHIEKRASARRDRARKLVRRN